MLHVDTTKQPFTVKSKLTQAVGTSIKGLKTYG